MGALTGLSVLWLPILISAAVVFVASSIIHMALGYHKADYQKVPNEDRFMDAVRPLAIPPGDYMVPRVSSSAEMKSPEFCEKLAQGPVVMMTVYPSGPFGMGKQLFQWFLFSVVVSGFAAYVAGRVLAPGAEYLAVFRFTGVTAFLAYSVALWPMSIWYKRSWGTTIRSTIDGLIYALLTGGVFGWLWPKM